MVPDSGATTRTHHVRPLNEPRPITVAADRGTPVSLTLGIRNVNRCVGGMLSSKIAETRGAGGLPADLWKVLLTG